MDIQTILDLLKQSPSIAILGIIIVFYNKKIKEYDSHLEKCQEVPKVLITSQLQSISDQLTVLHSRVSAHRQETKDEIEGVKEDLTAIVNRLDKNLEDYKRTNDSRMFDMANKSRLDRGME